jgi:hypothetical protein
MHAWAWRFEAAWTRRKRAVHYTQITISKDIEKSVFGNDVNLIFVVKSLKQYIINASETIV